MQSFEKEISSPSNQNIKLLKWKVRKGTVVHKGSVLALYTSVASDEFQSPCKLKADEDGTVVQLLAEEGGTVAPNEVMVRLHKAQTDQGCTHPTIMKDMCANCGADLREENGVAGDRKKAASASVAMVHSIPELIVSQDIAIELGRQDESRLLQQKKLVLLVDLDQTLIHTTNDQIPSNLKGVKHFQLWTGRNYVWYHTRFRPFTEQFLETISKMYELHICTFGVRLYAHTIARLLDPANKYFSHRILSRDECFDSLSKTPNLKALFPCGDEMVGIIDDREDVWNYAPNLVHVKAYRFFQGTADINAPPGLTKSENDDIPIIHKTKDSTAVDSTENKTISEGDMSVVLEESVMDTTLEVENKNSKTGDIETSDKIAKNIQEQPPEGSEKDLLVLDEKVEKELGNTPVDDEAKNEFDGQDSNEEKKSIDQDEKCKEEKTDQPADGASLTIEEMSTKEDCEVKDEVDKNPELEVRIDEVKTAEVEEKKTEFGEEKTEKDNLQEIEWEDSDDYLLHLEEILTRIHKAYYNMYEQSLKGGSKDLPDLKNIIPYVKKKVLKGVNIVFSGMFPVNIPPEKSKAYITAKSLGANVQSNIVPPKSKKSCSADATTHLVAAKAGTVKYKTALKAKHIHVVSGEWLWACAERWEWVSEQLFLMSAKKDLKIEREEDIEIKKGKKFGKGKRKREVDASEDSLQQNEEDDNSNDSNKGGKHTPPKKAKSKSKGKKGKGDGDNDKFASSYNPLLSFSNEDIEFMDKEVEEMMAEGNDSSESDDERDDRLRKNVLGNSNESDSDSDSLAGDFPRGWKMRRKSLSPEHRNPAFETEGIKTDQEEMDEETENELERYTKTVEAFAGQESSQDSYASGDSIGSVDEEIAAAVEKEFLGSL